MRLCRPAAPGSCCYTPPLHTQHSDPLGYCSWDLPLPQSKQVRQCGDTRSCSWSTAIHTSPREKETVRAARRKKDVRQDIVLVPCPPTHTQLWEIMAHYMHDLASWMTKQQTNQTTNFNVTAECCYNQPVDKLFQKYQNGWNGVHKTYIRHG